MRPIGTRGACGLALALLAACSTTPVLSSLSGLEASRAAVADASEPLGIPPLAEGDTGLVLVCGKVLTIDDQGRSFSPGVVVVRNGRIEAVGSARGLVVPKGYRRLDYPEGWAAPGLIDLHSHVHTGGWGDINDMVYPINAEFRTSPTIRPANPNVRRATAAGVTTLFGIPGSGTSISGFGVLYKTKKSLTYEDVIFRDPGGMKVAQDSNPQRDGNGDLGVARSALGWIIEDANDKAIAAARDGRFALEFENLKRIHSKELPVLIHTAGSDGVINTARMWRVTYDTRSVVSHGSFDGWKSAAYLAEVGIPVNNGPRTIDYASTRTGQVIGMAHEYHKAGVPLISLNTDAGVMPQEEFFLQGAMASRHGADSYLMLRAVTIHPAKAFGIDDRLGSLEPGKDADVVIFDGDPLDPRSAVEVTLIDGEVEYDRRLDGQAF